MYIIIHSSLNFQLSTYLTPGSDVNFMRGTTPWIEEGWRWNFDEVMNDDSILLMKLFLKVLTIPLQSLDSSVPSQL